MAANAPGGTGATAYEVSYRKFGGPIRPVSRIFTVTIGGVRILDNNPRRVAWLLVNRSTVDVTVDFVQPVPSGSAMLIAANGGTASAYVDEDGEIVAWELFGQSPAGNANIYVLEIMRG